MKWVLQHEYIIITKYQIGLLKTYMQISLKSKEYTMDMFSFFTNKIDPFDRYIKNLFSEKTSLAIGGSIDYDDKFLSYDPLRR